MNMKTAFVPNMYRQTNSRHTNRMCCLNIANIMDSEREEMAMQLLAIKMNIKIFKSDLTGNLQHDYDKDNKRYPGNWRIEKGKADAIKFKLLKIYDDNLEREKPVD